MDGEFYVVAMDLLGLSLEDLFNVCHRTFSVHTTARLAVQILSRLEYMHGKAFIHRDVKPENFLLDYATGQEVNVIDFGLATAYRDGHTRQHIAYRSGIPLAGTARYARYTWSTEHVNMGLTLALLLVPMLGFPV
eukprot:m.1016057 g.1016057  ORF g.1016057 m.1016057 type:complete len:135 (+) comp24077_c0_seq52:350-754(+)